MNQHKFVALLREIKEESAYLHVDWTANYQYYVCPLCGEQDYKCAKNIRHRNDCLIHKVTRAIYQATFPRIGNKPRYWDYYLELATSRLIDMARGMKWNMEVTRKHIAEALKGQRNQTVAEVREYLAQEEIHYHKLRKELARRQKARLENLAD